jgi:hypothetical protein
MKKRTTTGTLFILISMIISMMLPATLVQAQDIGAAVELLRDATREVIRAGTIPQSCQEISFQNIPPSINACTNFFDYACESMNNTVDDTSATNHAIFDRFNTAMDEFYESSGLAQNYRSVLAVANAGNASPQFAESISQTVNNFNDAYCSGKSNNSANRNSLIKGFFARLESGGNTPLFDTTGMRNIRGNAVEELARQCQSICLRNGSKTRSQCQTQCETSAEGNQKLDLYNLVRECEGKTESCLISRHVAYSFKFLSDSGATLNELCQEMTNVLVNAQDTFFTGSQAGALWDRATPELRTRTVSQMENAIFPPDFRTAAEQIYSNVRESGLELVERYAGGNVSATLRNRLSGVNIDWNYAQPVIATVNGRRQYVDRTAAEIPLADLWETSTSINAAYYHRDNEIRFMGGMSAQSPYQMMWTLAHEYGHAMDEAVGEHHGGTNLTPSRGDLQSCFNTNSHRNPRSNAIQHNLSPGHSQFGECKADYWGTEIFYNMLQEHVPALSQEEKKRAVVQTVLNCGQEGGEYSPSDAPHPPWRDRSQGIIMAHPGMRVLFGCSTDTANDPYYCPAGSNVPTGLPTPSPATESP